jgi:hypothetical protein
MSKFVKLFYLFRLVIGVDLHRPRLLSNHFEFINNIFEMKTNAFNFWGKNRQRVSPTCSLNEKFWKKNKEFSFYKKIIWFFLCLKKKFGFDKKYNPLKSEIVGPLPIIIECWIKIHVIHNCYVDNNYMPCSKDLSLLVVNFDVLWIY